MVVFENFREIVGLMVLIAGFSVALLVLPDTIHKPDAGSVPALLPRAQSDAQVEKIAVPIHTLFANQ